MGKSLLGVSLMLMVGAAPIFADDDCWLHRLCNGKPECEDSCDEGCRKSIGIGCRIPSIRWGISLDCSDDGCRHCSLCKKRCCWWDRLEPPRAPVVFSVPAVTVPQQALAVQPQLAPLAVAAPSAAPCRPQGLSETDKLLLEMLVSQAQAASLQNRAQTQETSTSSSSAALDPATEARLTKLEDRLDRILRLLEN